MHPKQNAECQLYPGSYKVRHTISIASTKFIMKIHELVYSKDTCILLDVGEGTMGQIHRFYGDEAENVIKKLKAIYISHLHADHHIGLFGIIQLRQQICDETHIPILLLAPSEIEPWIKFYKNEFEKISTEFEFIDNQTLVGKTFLSSTQVSKLVFYLNQFFHFID